MRIQSQVLLGSVLTFSLLFVACSGGEGDDDGTLVAGGSGGTNAGGSATGGESTLGGTGGAPAGGTEGGGTGGGGTGGAGTGGDATGGEAGCVPDLGCQPLAPSTGDIYADCAERVNQFRDCLCLPRLTRRTDAEACADQQAQYDYEQDTAHAGFSDGICSPGGSAQNECPGWRSMDSIIDGCLQGMFDEGPGPDGCADDWNCYMDHGHHINMANEGYTGVACGFYTTPSGEIWALHNFFR